MGPGRLPFDLNSEFNPIPYHKIRCISLNELTIDTANLKIGALSFGDPNDSPVIALHGWLDNAASFVPLANHLKGVHLIALDLPGHGHSAHRSGANAYHFIDYATDVLLTAQALGLNRFSLLGHSLGAGVGALIAAVAPDKVTRLALVEGLVPFTGAPKSLLKQLRRHIDETCKPASPRRVYESVEQAAITRQKVGDLSLAAAMLITERNLVKAADGYVWRTDRRLKKPSPLYLVDQQVHHYLSQIQCPALLIRSNQGIIRNWPSLSDRERHIEHLNVVDIEGGHHCHMDDPQSVARHLSPFLNATDSP